MGVAPRNALRRSRKKVWPQADGLAWTAGWNVRHCTRSVWDRLSAWYEEGQFLLPGHIGASNPAGDANPDISGRCVPGHWSNPMSCARETGRACRSPDGVMRVALPLSLGLSSFMMAAAIGSSEATWLAWIGLMPLFWAIRSLTPRCAALAGGLWGSCLCLFSVACFAPRVSSTSVFFVLLTLIPAVYAGLASLASRAIGFNPLILAFGWVLVEVALRPLGLPQGLLAGTQGNDPCFQWIARWLGYAFVALVLTGVNAFLLELLSCIGLPPPPRRSCLQLAPTPVRHVRPAFVHIRRETTRRAYPRGPPRWNRSAGFSI
jgi:hypothetical protein